MRFIIFILAGFALSLQAQAKNAAKAPAAHPAPPPCGGKLKSKIAKIEKKTASYAKKVAAFKAKHKSLTPKEGRMPAAFCGDKKQGMPKAAGLAKEGIPLAEELEKIETTQASCADMARAARLKVDELFMGLNSSYIQTCNSPQYLLSN